MNFFPSDVPKVYQVNVEGTRNLLNACSGSTTIRRFIYASSTETIGKTDDIVADEEAKLQPDSEYGKSKVLAEKVVRELGEKYSIPYIILRPCGVYGEGDTFVLHEVMSVINQGFLFFIPGNADKSFVMFVYIGDVVQALRLAITEGKLNSTYNIAPDESLTFIDYLTMIGKELGRSPPFMRIPIGLLQPVVFLIKPLMNIGRTRTFMWQEQTMGRMKDNRLYSNKKARAELSWKPSVTVKEGIERTIKSHYKDGSLVKMYFSPVFLISVVLGMLIVYFLAF